MKVFYSKITTTVISRYFQNQIQFTSLIIELFLAVATMITRAETIIPITRVLNRSTDPFEPLKTFELFNNMIFLTYIEALVLHKVCSV